MPCAPPDLPTANPLIPYYPPADLWAEGEGEVAGVGAGARAGVGDADEGVDVEADVDADEDPDAGEDGPGAEGGDADEDEDGAGGEGGGADPGDLDVRTIPFRTPPPEAGEAWGRTLPVRRERKMTMHP
eukprot:697849-Amorphochlora_amoeboformis.AAC.1